MVVPGKVRIDELSSAAQSTRALVSTVLLLVLSNNETGICIVLSFVSATSTELMENVGETNADLVLRFKNPLWRRLIRLLLLLVQRRCRFHLLLQASTGHTGCGCGSPSPWVTSSEVGCRSGSC